MKCSECAGDEGPCPWQVGHRLPLRLPIRIQLYMHGIVVFLRKSSHYSHCRSGIFVVNALVHVLVVVVAVALAGAVVVVVVADSKSLSRILVRLTY